MEIIRGLEAVKHDPQGLLTVGSFDGLHLGHQRILRRMKSHGGGPVAVLTFDPHPQAVVRRKGDTLPLLTSFEERVELFRHLGVDRLIITRFDRGFSAMAPEDFVRDVLVGTIGLSRIFVGPGHRFGVGRKGDTALLRSMAGELEFRVEVVPPVVRDGAPISSSRIRRALTSGEAKVAMSYLGRPFFVEGEVVAGDKRGRELGVPTANVRIEDHLKLIPAAGVYATVTEANGFRYPSVSHFGARPTFKGAEPAVETHLLDFRGELYGCPIRIGLVERLRDVAAFDTPDELSLQMSRDISAARRRLAALGFGKDVRQPFKRFGRIAA